MIRSAVAELLEVRNRFATLPGGVFDWFPLRFQSNQHIYPYEMTHPHST